MWYLRLNVLESVVNRIEVGIEQMFPFCFIRFTFPMYGKMGIKQVLRLLVHVISVLIDATAIFI